MTTSQSDGEDGTRAEVEEVERGDGLLASLADELVWKGEDGEEEEEEYGDDEEYDGYEFEEGEALEGLDLESLGISMMVSFLS